MAPLPSPTLRLNTIMRLAWLPLRIISPEFCRVLGQHACRCQTGGANLVVSLIPPLAGSVPGVATRPHKSSGTLRRDVLVAVVGAHGSHHCVASAPLLYDNSTVYTMGIPGSPTAIAEPGQIRVYGIHPCYPSHVIHRMAEACFARQMLNIESHRAYVPFYE